MLQRFLPIILVSIFICCSDNKPKVSSIEYIGFNWTTWDAEIQQEVPYFFLKCRSYAYIDAKGNAKGFIYGNTSSPNSHFYLFKVNPDIIGKLEQIATERNKEILDSIQKMYLKPIGKPIPYEGPFIKVRLNYSDGKSYIFGYEINDAVFKLFPPLSDITNNMNGLAAKASGRFHDTIEFKRNMLDFIKRSIQHDSSYIEEYKLPIRILFDDKIEYADSIFKTN